MRLSTPHLCLALLVCCLLACEQKGSHAEADPALQAALVKEITQAAGGCDQAPPAPPCPPAVAEGAAAEDLIKRLGATSLPTLLRQLRENDPKVSFVAAQLIGGPFYAEVVAPDEGPVLPKAQARSLLAYLLRLSPKAEPQKAALLMRPAVSIGLVSGQEEHVWRLMEAMRPEVSGAHKRAYLVGLSELMARGQMKGFERVAGAMKSEDKEVRAAAFEAPLRMTHWSQEEQDKLCPLAAEGLAARALELDAAASAMLLRCTEGSPKGRPLILAEAKERLKQSTYRPPLSDTVLKVCSPVDREDDAMNSVCEGQREVLLQVLAQPTSTLREHERFLAAQTLATQWPELVTTLERALPTFSVQKQQELGAMLAHIRQGASSQAPASLSTTERTRRQIEEEERAREEAEREAGAQGQ